ncbi:MAG: ParA family protein [Alphaproteobacteria bacterium]|nr:ParA family protein [Alphaproteobacteria bacterium]
MSQTERRGKVLVAATGKGGAGKSTLVACLGTFWHQRKKAVALVDADPNRTLSRWHSKGDGLAKISMTVQLDEHEMIPTITSLAREHDVVLVDCAGFGNQAMIFAIGAADLVLIPAMTDEASLFEAMKTRRIVDSASQLTNRTIEARSVLCRVKRSAVAQHAHTQLAALNCNPLDIQMADRVSHQEASFHGSSPYLMAPSSPAAKDVEKLAREVERVLWPTSRA